MGVPELENPYYVDEPTDLSHSAPHDSLLGRLQRGRGQGYLDALCAPRDVATALAFECLTDAVEPERLIGEEGYYAELLLELNADCSPLREHLRERDDPTFATLTALPALGTLQYLTLYGHPEAERWLLEYAERGTHWHLAIQDVLEVRGEAGWPSVEPILRSRAEDTEESELYDRWVWLIAAVEPWEERFGSIPRFANAFRADWEQRDNRPKLGGGPSPASVREFLFELDDQPPNFEWFKSLPETITSEDYAALEDAVLQGDYTQMRKAFGLLKRLGRKDLAWEACLFHLSGPELKLDCRQSIALDYLARRLVGEMALPKAREWLHSPIVHQRLFAAGVLAHHARAEDRPVLIETVEASLDPFRPRSLRDLVSALARFEKAGPLPVVEHLFELATGSWLREAAAEALVAGDAKRFQQAYAFECLWDSGEEVRASGIAAKPTGSQANRRIQHLGKRPEPELLI